MNDKPGGMPSPFSFAPAAGPGPSPTSSPISPSNFGAKPAPASPSSPIPTGPTPSMTPYPNTPTNDNTSGVDAINAAASAAPNPATTPNPGVPSSTPTGTVPNAAPTNPMDRPMEKAAAPVPQTPKPKKTGLIIGIAVGVGVLVIAIIIAVVAAVMLNRPDPVQAALDKLLSGQGSPNIQVKGNINLTSDAQNTPSGLGCNFAIDSKLTVSSLINDTSVIMNCSSDDSESLANLEFDEMYPGNGDLYFRIDGITTLFESNSETTDENCDPYTENCISTDDETYYDDEYSEDEYYDDEYTSDETFCDEDDEYCESTDEETTDSSINLSTILPNSSLGDSLSLIFESIDGEWIKIPANENDDKTAVDPSVILGTAGTTNCTSAFIDSFRSNQNTIAGLYRKNPFVQSTDENIQVAKKNYPVYKITIDRDAYNAFIDGAESAGVFKDYDACIKGDNGSVTSTDDDGSYSTNSNNNALYTSLVDRLKELPNSFPELYVEINNNYEFTRLYWTVDSDNTKLTFDFNLSYPADIQVSEPVEYTDVNDLFQELFSSNYLYQQGYEDGSELIEEGETIED